MTLSPDPKAEPAPLLMWSILRSFIWLDRCLQTNMHARGWPAITRSESQLMLLASAGIVRPVEISKALGLSRQAVNQTLKLLTEKNLIELRTDPEDKRCKIIGFAKAGEDMRADARKIISQMEQELAKTLSPAVLTALRTAVDQDWGDIPVFPKP